jgi:CO dehydrogenase maturation factor
MTVSDTLGQAREEMKKGQVPSGMTKDVFMSMRMEQAIVESKDFDLVVMGQPEGAGCYCAANTLLTGFLEKLVGNYRYLVMDNEAGMEHISRLTTHDVDVLLIVSDTSRRSLQAAVRISELARELKIGVKRNCLIVNQAKNGARTDAILQYIEGSGLEFLGAVPEDEAVYDYDMKGQPTMELPEESASVKAAFDLFSKIVNGS